KNTTPPSAATPPPPAATTTGPVVAVVGAAGIFARRNLCSPKLLARRILWAQSCRHLC
ncbi:hypothetical protein Tco_0099062, partial [Tanacetum coccineum]